MIDSGELHGLAVLTGHDRLRWRANGRFLQTHAFVEGSWCHLTIEVQDQRTTLTVVVFPGAKSTSASTRFGLFTAQGRALVRLTRAVERQIADRIEAVGSSTHSPQL